MFGGVIGEEFIKQEHSHIATNINTEYRLGKYAFG